MAKETLTGWSMQIRPNGDKVSLLRDKKNRLSRLHFEKDGNSTTIMLSDEALMAVVSLAIHRAGIPVVLDWRGEEREP